LDAVVGALPEILAAVIPDGARVAPDTFHETGIEAGELARLENHFIWACFKEIHGFFLD
jgi:hypothetical protein